MARNNSALFRLATAFRQIYVRPEKFKKEQTDSGDRGTNVMATLEGAQGQTADMLQLTDYLHNVDYGVDLLGSRVGISPLRVAHAIYNFAVDGGLVSTITPVLTAAIPAYALIWGGIANPTTAVTSAGSLTMAVGTSAGSSTTALLAATAKASLSIDALIALVPTLAAPIKMTAAGNVTVTIAAAAATAGIVEIFVFYTVAQNA